MWMFKPGRRPADPNYCRFKDEQRGHLLTEHRHMRFTRDALFVFWLRRRQLDIWSSVRFALP